MLAPTSLKLARFFFVYPSQDSSDAPAYNADCTDARVLRFAERLPQSLGVPFYWYDRSHSLVVVAVSPILDTTLATMHSQSSAGESVGWLGVETISWV